MSGAWWYTTSSGELVALGTVSDLRIDLTHDASAAPLIRRTELSIDLKLTPEQWQTWANWMRDENRYQRLRRQHKAKGAGKNWKRAA